MGRVSHVQRTLEYLRNSRYVHIGKVEQYNSFSFQKSDLFGIFDYLAIRPGASIVDTDKMEPPRIIGIQICGSDYASHVRTIDNAAVLPNWLEAGGVVLLIGWRKLLKKRGGKAKIWTPRIQWWRG